MNYLSSVCGVTLLNDVRNDEACEKFGIAERAIGKSYWSCFEASCILLLYTVRYVISYSFRSKGNEVPMEKKRRHDI